MWSNTYEIGNSLVTVIPTVHALPIGYELPSWVYSLVKESDIVCLELNSSDIAYIGEKKEKRLYTKEACASLSISDPWMWISLGNSINTVFMSHVERGIDECIIECCLENDIPQVSLELREDQEKMYVGDLTNKYKLILEHIHAQGLTMLSEVPLEEIKEFGDNVSNDMVKGILELTSIILNSQSRAEFYSIVGSLVGCDEVNMANRNFLMAMRAAGIARENPGKHILVAVGAAHTIGIASVNKVLVDHYGAIEEDMG